MSDYTLPAALRISDAVVFRELDGEAVLLNLDSGVYFGLDEVGTRFWQLVEQHGRLEPVLTALFQEYDVTVGRRHRGVGAHAACGGRGSIAAARPRARTVRVRTGPRGGR
jgi:hypothetical protein